MAQVVRPYRGVSADERRALRRSRLVEAALDVAGDEGVAGMTMKAVCARAGLTERYYYESFRSRDELLLALVDPLLEEIRAKVLAELEASPPDLLARARATASALVEVLTDDPRKARIFIEAPASEALRDRQAEAVQAYADLLAEQMRELMGLGAKRHRGRLALATLVLVGGTAQAVASWLDGSIDLSRDEVLDELARLCVAAAETVEAT